jgi:HEPN domain-containing protein
MPAVWSKDASRFLRASAHRMEEAEFLLTRGDFTTASVYLAGYAVECMLKALILCNESPSKNARTVSESFRGEKAHSFEWLKEQLAQRRVVVASQIAKDLARLNLWSTTLRYDPVVLKRRDAEAFLRAAKGIILWAKGRT